MDEITSPFPPIDDPVAFRSAIVSSLVRTLHGPTEAIPNWLGPKPVRVLTDGDSIDEQRPVGPYADQRGQEILATNPRYLYLTGVLWGSHDSQPGSEEEPATESEDDENKPSHKGRRGKNVGHSPAEEGGEHDDQDREETADDVDQMGRRRSLAFSFRATEKCDSATLRVSFASYTSMAVTFGDKSQRMWRRTPYEFEERIDITASQTFQRVIGGIHISFATRVRVDLSTSSRLVTVSISNTSTPADITNADEAAMFQTELRLGELDLLPYAGTSSRPDSLDLLYRNVERLAIGHGTDVVVSENHGAYEVRSVAVPIVELPVMTPDIVDSHGTPLAVGMQDLAEMNTDAITTVERLIAEYRKWIEARRSELGNLPDAYKALGIANVGNCEIFLNELIDGWKLVGSNSEVSRCLRDASSAMNSQRIGSTAPLREVKFSGDAIEVQGENPHAKPDSRQSMWRPFQIAFVLASIPKIFDPNHSARKNVDVIWMPTGGGKTEAYLGLSAFTILWERRQLTLTGATMEPPSTKVMMRYTLRLLTAQQFVRCSALICALELTRAKQQTIYGTSEIRIGTWVGASATPNNRKVAIAKLNAALDQGEPLPFTLTRCPWCGTAIGDRDPTKKKIAGYKITQFGRGKPKKRTLAFCPDPECPFTLRDFTTDGYTVERGLPVLEVDEDVYAFPPDFVVGTVDKAAMMWDQIEAAQLFGIRNGRRQAKTRPPALLIQDELHLITGPLGSLDGLFELVFEELCSTDGGRPPLVVASTATTKNFESQVRGLYDRSAKLVPPPGLEFTDSFFSVVDHKKPSRMYVGICASSGTSNADTQAAVVGALAHFPAALRVPPDSPNVSASDPYWTNVCFFSSRTALGTLFSIAESDLPRVLDRIRQAGGGDSGSLRDDGHRRTRRVLRNPREITATSSENVVEVLDDLSIRQGEDGVIDLCFATSMIEVGLDVSRLGLMTVIGQPKSSSQYIQATGRVGRSERSPALVVDVLGTRTPRDRSHYERFTLFHKRLYASVDGASVTPFSLPALERTLPTIAAILCRAFAASEPNPSAIAKYWPHFSTLIMTRASSLGGPSATTNARRVLDDLLLRSQSTSLLGYAWSDRKNPEKSFLFSFGSPVPHSRKSDFWNVLTSLRSVDPDAVAHPIAVDGPSKSTTAGDAEDLDGI
jgi:hypothetical protein